MKFGFDSERFSYDAQSKEWSRSFPELDSDRTLLIVFGSPNEDSMRPAIRSLRKSYPKSFLVGCSTAGEIHGVQVLDDSLTVGVARFAFTKLRQSIVAVANPKESYNVGKRVAQELAGDELQAIFILSDGLNVNGSELIRGINSLVGTDVVVTGGLAGDGTRFEKTWVVAGDVLGPSMVTAIGFYGKHFQVHHGSRGGWNKFGPERDVTSSEGNVLSALDGEPALALYEKYLGDKAKDLPSSGLLFPLAIKPPNEDKILVRTLLGIDRAAGTMTFAGDIPEGSKAQLMKANFDRLIDGAEDAAKNAFKDWNPEDAGLTIAVSCVGRRLVLGDRTEDELDAVSSIIQPEKSPVVGFYSYGELSPVGMGACDLHNQTMTLTIFSEKTVDAAIIRSKLLNKTRTIPRPASLKKPVAAKVPAPVEAAKTVERTLTSTAAVYSLTAKSWSGELPAVDSSKTLVLAFGSPNVWEEQDALKELYKRYPNSHVIGCSGAGEIAGDVVLDESISVTVSQFKHTELRRASTKVAKPELSFAAGQKLAEELDRADLQSIFILSEGLNVNGTELVRGVNSIVDDNVIVTGGLAGDGSRFERTWVFVDGEVQTNVVAAIAFYGDYVLVSHGSQGGWDSFGPRRKVTRSEGNVLFELDGNPALALYKTYLGDKADDLPASGLLFPLALIDAGDESRNVVRTLLAVDHDAQSLTFAGDIPEGANVQLTKAHFDKLVGGAQGAAEMACIQHQAGGKLAIAVSCVGRRLVLGDRTEDELDVVQEHVGPDAVVTGFYSYGELSPVVNGRCDLHNQTMTLTVFGESDTPVRSTLKDVPATQDGSFQSKQLTYRMETQEWSEPLPDLDSRQSVVLAFGAPELWDAQEVFGELEEKYPNSHIIGCSSSGEIAGSVVLDESLSIAVTRFQYTKIRSASTLVASADRSFDAGQKIAESLRAPGLRAIFILSEGLNVNGTDLVRGVNSMVRDDVIVTGGLAGDGSRFERTWVYSDGKIETHKVAAIGFYGDELLVSHGSQGGWDSFGPERVATRTEGNVLYELDGKPALALYKAYLGDKAKDLPSSGLLFPLSILDPVDESRNVVRTLLAVDQEKQSLTFAGDIPEGSKVQLMKAHFDRLVDGAENAAEMTRFDENVTNSLVIAVSCVGRRLVLGDRTEDELDAVSQKLGQGVALTGFYSYGELSPIAEGTCALHNQTMTLTAFSERPPTKREFVTAVDFDKTMARPKVGFATSACIYDLEKKQWAPHLPSTLNSRQTLVLAFGSPSASKHQDGFADLKASFPDAHILGCSGAGEIAGNMVVDDSLSVAVVRFEKTLLKTSSVQVDSADDSFEAGKKLANELAGDALRAIFILSEGLSVNGTALIRGVNEIVSEDVVVTGGLAGDGTRFENTWVYADGKVQTKTVAAVGFYGDYVQVSHGSQGGWDSFGPVRKVTKSQGNVLHELDGTPALALYKTYLGDKAKDLPSSGLLFPLSILDEGDGEERNVVRTLLAVDQDAQTLTFAGDIPEGARVQLMKAHFNKLVDGAESAATMANFEGMNENALAIAVSCVGRRLVLGDRTEEELEAVVESLPRSAVLTGFYSYGELSPITEGRCDLHNQTMTLTLFGEASTPVTKAQPKSDLRRKVPAIPQKPLTPKQEKPVPPLPKSPVKVSGQSPAPKAKTAGGKRTRSTLPVRSSELRAGPIQVQKIEADGVTTVRLVGKLDEKFNGAGLGRELHGIVLLDLAEVHRVTSFGVREWLGMLRESKRIDTMYLARCSEPISNQLATIRAFAGDAEVVSFYAPYMCEHCSTSFNALLDVELDAEDIQANHPPSVTCIRCNKETTALDEDAATFFSFAQSGCSVPNFVRAQITSLPELRSAESVEKSVNDTGTVIRINTTLDESIRWRRLLDGVEGRVVIDFAGVSSTTNAGVADFVVNAAKHDKDATFDFVDVPYEVLKALQKSSVRATFRDVEVMATCPDGSQVRAIVNIPSNKEALERGDVPEATSREYSGDMDLSAAFELLNYAAGVVQTPKTQAPLPKLTNVPAAVSTEVSASNGHMASWQLAVIGLFVVVLLFVIVNRTVSDEASAPEPEVPAEVVVAAKPESPPAEPTMVESSPKEVPADTPPKGKWSTDSGVRPSWSDRNLAIEGEKMFLVGEGVASSQDASLAVAQEQAVLRLVGYIKSELRGHDIYELLSRGEQAEPAEVATTFLRQMGPAFVFKRHDQAFKEDANKVTAVVRFEVPISDVNRAISKYSRVLKVHSASFGTRFPTMKAPGENDVVVLTSRTVRVRPGDVVLSESQKPVFDLSQFKKRIRSKEFLRLVVSSNSVAKSMTIRARRKKEN